MGRHKKKPIGRPKKDPSEVRRNEVGIRLTDEEKYQLDYMVYVSGCSKSFLLRNALERVLTDVIHDKIKAEN